MSAEQWLPDNYPNIESRDYQVEAWDSLWLARANGQQRALIQLATGLGKTLVSAIDVMHYIAEENPSARILFVSHVTDISRQAKHAFQFVNKTLADRCTFTTFQWLSFNPTVYAPDEFDYIIYDEAHHSEADTFKEIRNYFQPKFALALTATPGRGDGRDIMEYFGNPVYTKTLAEGIAEGWLSPVDYHLVLDDTLKKAVNDNFKVESLGELRALFKLKIRDEQIANEVKQRQEAIGLADAQTIVFCNTIENAQHIAGILGGKPYYADLHPVERTQTLKEFRDGKLRTICTVDMFNEGIDIPNARLIVFLRSTSSRTIFEQQLGRGLRRAPGKTHVTVLDFAANIERINFTRDLGHTISRLRGVEDGYSGFNT
jgi:superfamily II DNA or RNA helicase